MTQELCPSTWQWLGKGKLRMIARDKGHCPPCKPEMAPPLKITLKSVLTLNATVQEEHSLHWPWSPGWLGCLKVDCYKVLMSSLSAHVHFPLSFNSVKLVLICLKCRTPRLLFSIHRPNLRCSVTASGVELRQPLLPAASTAWGSEDPA